MPALLEGQRYADRERHVSFAVAEHHTSTTAQWSDGFDDVSEPPNTLNTPEQRQSPAGKLQRGIAKIRRTATSIRLSVSLSKFLQIATAMQRDEGADVMQLSAEEQVEATEACIKIQRVFRGKVARQSFQARRAAAAATKLQARFRGIRARRKPLVRSMSVKQAQARRLRRNQSKGLLFRMSSVPHTRTPAMLNVHHFISLDSLANQAFRGAELYGQLEFVGDTRRRKVDMKATHIEDARQAKFCRVRVPRDASMRVLPQLSPEHQNDRIEVLRGMVDYLRFGMKVRMPCVIFDMTGSAVDVNLRPAFFERFTTSLLHATRNTSAWVVTGGTDGGIMKLVGDALSTVNSSEVSLGIAPWSALHGRSRLEERTFAKIAGTVRVTLSDADEAYFRKQRVDVQQHLRYVFSRYGRVSGINAFRLQASDPKLNKVEMAEKELPLTEDPVRKRRWIYVTFDNRRSALRAKALQRAKMAGRAVALNTVLVDSRGTVQQRGGWFGGHADLADPKETAQRKSYTMHIDALLSSRGSSALPYMYDGRRDFYREPKRGTTLNPNHSHYILVDDQTQGTFGADVAIRSDLLEFISYRRDTETCSTEQLSVRCANKLGQRFAPVITFIFGGGKQTFATCKLSIAHCRPIIICKGSGRCADLIADWKTLNLEMLELTSSSKISHEAARETMREKQNLLARAWCCNPINGSGGRLTEDSLLIAKINQLRTELDSIISYPELHIFDIEDASDDLMHVVLRSIFDSPTIASSVKLPLAIRYGSQKNIKRIMMGYGPKRLVDSRQEMSTDGRLLVFAAFHDDADAVQTLIDWGFDLEQLDNLIFLELHQLAELNVLDNIKEYRPPRSWLGAYRQQRSRARQKHSDKVQYQKWMSMSAQEQLSEANKEWGALSTRKQYQILREDICRVNWEKMPCLSGWTFRAVHFLGYTRKGYGDEAREKYLGQGFTLQRVQRHLGASMTAEFCAPSGSIVEGVFLSASEAQQLVEHFVGECDEVREEQWKDHFLLGSGRWVALHDPDVPMQMENWGQRPNVLLQQCMFDSVVGALDIDEHGHWIPGDLSKQRDMSKVLIRNAFKAFKEWIDMDSVEIGIPWWEMHRSTDAKEMRSHCLYEHSLDPLHRIFWAVMTSRNKLAEMLWKLQPARGAFAGAFLAGYAIGHATVSSESKQLESLEHWNKKTLRFLDEMLAIGDPKCIRAVFDQYLYFGLEEEVYAHEHPELPTKYAALSDAQKLNNAKRRAALQLMDCDIDTPKTRVDLALAADCQTFLGHTATEQFMDYLWASRSYDSYSEHLLRGTVLSVLTVPRVKYVSSLVCWLTFGIMFSLVYSSYEPPTRMKGMLHPGRDMWTRGNALEDTECSLCLPWEAVFWLWVFGLMLNEAYQFHTDFESLVEYIGGSGNLLDGTIQLTFLVAFILRVVSLILWQSEDDLSQDELRRCDDNYPACHMYLLFLFLLGLNVIAVGIRILYNLNVFREIGILLIIVKDIVTKDVVPFISVLMIFVVCFEVTGVFFFLASDEDFSMYDSGSYFLTWIDVGNMPDMPTALGHDRWLNSAFQQRFPFVSSAHFLYKTFFFIITGIILTNLLIAMMSDRFANVQAAATQIWRATFSGQVREFCDATIFPLPFNLFELVLNMCTKEKFEADMHLQGEPEQEDQSAVWGRHYVWPLPTNAFDLHFALNREEITSTKVSPVLAEVQAIRDTQLKKSREDKKRESFNLQSKRRTDAENHGIMVKIIDKTAIDMYSTKLAQELGVHELWHDGEDHSRIGPGFHVYLGQVPPAYEDEGRLMNVFSCYGDVLVATVRKRSGHYDDGEPCLSWAIVSFTTQRAADDAISANTQHLPPELKGLRVRELDSQAANESTGAMGTVFHRHIDKAQLRSAFGTMVSETAGSSYVTGQRVCAVRLYCDSRVLLVRRSGLQEVAYHTVQSAYGHSGSIFELAWDDDPAWPAPKAQSAARTIINRFVEPVTGSTDCVATDASPLAAQEISAVVDEFTSLLSGPVLDDACGSQIDSKAEQEMKVHLPSPNDSVSSSSLVPSRSASRRVVCTPGTSAGIGNNAEAASLVANALREHQGDVHVQRAAQRLDALLHTMMSDTND